MHAKTLELNIPSDIFITLNEPESQLLSEIKFFIALRFFTMNKLTLGQAARLTGMTRFEFETALSRQQIPISNLTIDDIEHDIRVLHNRPLAYVVFDPSSRSP